MSLVPGAHSAALSPLKGGRRRSSNIFSRSRRLSPHPGIVKSQGSSLMSLYSVDTDVTTSSIQSIRRRFDNFSNKQDDKYRNLAMAEVMAATKHIRVPSPCMKTKEPTNPPAVATYRKCVGVANEIFPDQNWPKKKYFDCHNKESMNEWDIMKDCDKGKTCTWDGVHRHIMTSFDYNSVTHRPRVLKVQRNGIPEASRGDKSYQTPEYSSNFHKQGSTRPVPNFGGRAHNPCDTYIPLVKPTGQRKTFQERERERQDEENAAIVSQLEEWRPATPLVWRPNKNLARVDYSSIHTSHQ